MKLQRLIIIFSFENTCEFEDRAASSATPGSH